MQGGRFQPRTALGLVLVLPMLTGCAASSGISVNGLSVPVPSDLAEKSRYAPPGKYLPRGEAKCVLTPLSVIRLTFERNPQIKRAYLNYAAEQARYDYIVATWTSLTPGFSISAGTDQSLDPDDEVSRTHSQEAKVFMDQNFLNTSRLRLSANLHNEEDDGLHASHPSISASLRYPLWGSREALARSSEQIFQQNRVNDAQLGYVQTVRWRLRLALAIYFGAVQLRQRADVAREMLEDLRSIAERIRAEGGPSAASDLQRLESEMTSVGTQVRNLQSRYQIELESLKAAIGLPFYVDLELVEEPFDPFGEVDREKLLQLSMQTDPEIATLKNAIKNAQVQLALARKGRLDIALLLSGSMDMRGTGQWTGKENWKADAGLEVRFVDSRVSDSLEREAAATVARFQQAMLARRNDIHVGTIEPLIQAQTLKSNIEDIRRNIDRYKNDYQTGLEAYFKGQMNIDDLIQRRRNLFNEKQDLILSKSRLGQRMADLASATGKFFELLEKAPVPTTQPAPGTRPDLSQEG